MCTVTFIARKNGYALGMNRDEKRTRAIARPPALEPAGERHALFPSEPSGGTWIGVNDTGAGFALINWYSISARVARQPVSRGEVVKVALAADSVGQADEILAALPLDRMNPFRLIGFFPAGEEIVEWRWNLKKLKPLRHRWEAGTWISSGHDEPGAQESRGKNFAIARRQSSAGRLAWLRRLHRSHRPACGPYSICMHREDAVTVSYTEVVVSLRRAVMRYHPETPCQNSTGFFHSFSLPIPPPAAQRASPGR
jgi:hypothetical protein